VQIQILTKHIDIVLEYRLLTQIELHVTFKKGIWI